MATGVPNAIGHGRCCAITAAHRREEDDMIIHGQSLELVTELVRANRDLEAAFVVCAARLENDAICLRLIAQARVCASAAKELADYVRAHGGEVADDGTWGSDTAPDWVALRNALMDGNEAAVLDECSSAEDRLLIRFRDVLEHRLSGAIRNVLQTYFATLIQNRARLRELRLPALLRERPGPRHAPAPRLRSVKMTQSL
jgi:uncharacterized protein (TIGR02284 family)